MDDRIFDDLIRTMVDAGPTRRAVLRGLTSSFLAAALARIGWAEAEAGKKRRKKRKKCRRSQRKCGKRCIPKSHCCTAANCGFQGVCVQGVCICLGGAKPCAGSCIPESHCCTDGDCQAGTGLTCQNGACACPTDKPDFCDNACQPCCGVCEGLSIPCDCRSDCNARCFLDVGCCGNLECRCTGDGCRCLPPWTQ